MLERTQGGAAEIGEEQVTISPAAPPTGKKNCKTIMRKMNFITLYGYIGWILCGLAGAIIGFVTVGVWTAILGMIGGLFVGNLFKKFVLSHTNKGALF